MARVTMPCAVHPSTTLASRGDSENQHADGSSASVWMFIDYKMATIVKFRLDSQLCSIALLSVSPLNDLFSGTVIQFAKSYGERAVSRPTDAQLGRDCRQHRFH
jgi:hypothetical protein